MDFDKLKITDRKIIVGIDFGTTYSGVAWAESRNPSRRTCITQWPVSSTNREGESSDKVPTKLRYNGSKIEWGFSIPITAPQDEVIEWFKLDLDPSLQAMGQTVTADGGRGGRNVDTLVTDFISQLGDHLLYTLREKLGDSIVSSTPLEFVVTVPAIWSDLAKDKTKKACQKASGLSASQQQVHLVSEPEAAAIYALHGLDPHGLKAGDTIVVVDAGGGTVDLISYTITGLKPVLEVQEAAPGSGALCGSTFLNMRFAKYLRGKLGKEEGFDDEVMAEAMEVFEKKIKRQFALNVSPDETYNIPVAGLANNKALGISRGRFGLKASDLQTIFEPVVLEVIRLVKDQITASNVPVRAILLVGGFGASSYLKERLRIAVDNSIQIMQPPNAWQAIVQGAVLKGLANAASDLAVVRVKNRKARKHYGTEWRARWDDKLHGHLKSKRTWCGLDGCYKVLAMEWFITRGSAVSENEPYFTSFVWTGPVSQGRIRKVKMTIYNDQLPRDAPVARDEDVKVLANVEADVSHIPEHQLGRRQGSDNEWYYELNCKIEAVYLSASTTYTLLYNSPPPNSWKMLRCIRNKASGIWHKRKAETISTPPVPAENYSATDTDTGNGIENNIPSTISTDSENEQQPPQTPRYGPKFFYPHSPVSVPSTALPSRQHDQELVAPEPVIGHSTPDNSGAGSFTPRYVPYTDASPLKNNMFASQRAVYGRINPDIMGGLGDDDDSIWLVDDEETPQEEHHPPTYPDLPSQLEPRSSGSTLLHPSATQPQAPGPAPSPSTQPAFRYQRPSFLDEGEFTSNPLPSTAVDREMVSCQDSTPIFRRGYAPVAASILNLADLGVDSNCNISSDNSRNIELPRKSPKLASPVVASSSPSSTNPYKDIFEQKDNAMTTAYLHRLEQSEGNSADDIRFGQRYQQAADSSDVILTHQRTPRSTVVGDLECIVCADTKHVDAFPRFSVTATCAHPPSTCLDCIQLSIESDLSSKLWTEIRCPECRELLEYADIQRYANQQTFTKYETIALRAAMSEAENFVWCTSGCGSGQIHESGSDHPIVTCLHCNHRSCFQHNVAWHETLSCEEYDQLLADPDNFRSHLELENEKWTEAQRVQLEADRALAQGLIAEDQAEMRRREERNRREREQAQIAAQLARQIAARRQKEEAKSNATLNRTTKPCAGCGWAIEKNRGCSHMTCIKCKHEFCFECGANHRDIMRGDNSIHKKTCRFHPDNLPEMGRESR
ncbi:heat shock 70 kDa 12A [Fusarium heterosporum]|uniref:Heat shock 70 kDa 12A n=1 Tax=Fusarium heterosporum TaxID=42747 RepID=A0A8H5T6B8_FUSHE|nr:heat shock 70 kDa 12A [Fusarium heterosporum]